MTTLTMTTLIEPGERCTLCPRCSQYLTTAQERKDRLCASCADQPAADDVHPVLVVDWAMKKVQAEGKPTSCRSTAPRFGMQDTRAALTWARYCSRRRR